jgi:hypothetical protein
MHTESHPVGEAGRRSSPAVPGRQTVLAASPPAGVGERPPERVSRRWRCRWILWASKPSSTPPPGAEPLAQTLNASTHGAQCPTQPAEPRRRARARPRARGSVDVRPGPPGRTRRIAATDEPRASGGRQTVRGVQRCVCLPSIHYRPRGWQPPIGSLTGKGGLRHVHQHPGSTGWLVPSRGRAAVCTGHRPSRRRDPHAGPRGAEEPVASQVAVTPAY